jgi:hypothetical protein
VRLIAVAAAVLVAAAACTLPARPAPSVERPDPPPGEARPFAVALDDARQWLVERTLRCEPLEIDVGSAVRCIGDYRATEDAYYAVVDVLAGDGALVTLLEATVDVSHGGRADLSGMDAFLSDTVLGIVAVPVPDTADRWIRGHLMSPGATIIDGLVLEMTVGPARSALRMWHRQRP